MVMTRRAALIGAATAAGTLASRKGARADEPTIRLGLLSPLSGSQALTGKPVLLGAEVARDYINRTGGVSGRQIELVVRDERGDPKQAVAAVNELRGLGVNLVVGPPLTASALAVTSIMPSLGSVFIATGTNLDALAHELYNPNFFSVATNNYTRCRAYALLMAKRFPDLKSWGGIFPDVSAGHAAWDWMSKFLKEYYGEAGKTVDILDPVVTKYGATDFKDVLSRLMGSPVQGLVSVLFGADAITFFQQSKAFGLDRKVSAIADYALNLDLAKTLGRGMPRGVWAVSEWYYAGHDDNPLSTDLVQQSIARGNDPYPPGISSLGHAGVMAFAAAVRKAGKTDTASVIAALEGLTVDTVRGPNTFRREDHQAFGGIDFFLMGPKEADPGWQVSDYTAIAGVPLANPATPGVALKL